MNDPSLAQTLKHRLAEWRLYVSRPGAPPAAADASAHPPRVASRGAATGTPEPTASNGAHGNDDLGAADELSPRPCEPMVVDIDQVDAGPAAGVAEPAGASVLPVPYADTIVARYEAQVADLRAALAYERERSQKLTDALARELAARSLTRRLESTSPDPAWARKPSPIWSRAARHYNQPRAENPLLWGAVLLLLALVCTLVSLLFLR